MIYIVIILLNTLFCHASVSLEPAKNRMVKQLVKEVHQNHKIPETWLNTQFQDLKLNESVLNLMQKPFEAKPWTSYERLMLSQKRIHSGQTFMLQHRDVLNYYEAKYQIPASVVSSIIGIETSYGTNKGNFNGLEALTTLAFYYTPRSQFFRGEMISLLRYAYKNQIATKDIKSSYAGAVGIPQFMPSNIDLYGKHHGKTGKLDLYNDPNDAIASVFNYLKVVGRWKPNQAVMKRLDLPKQQHQSLLKMMGDTRMLPVTKSIEQHYNLRHQPKTWIIKLQTSDHEYALYRVFENFKSIMSYNNSVHYSSAVYELSKRLQPAS